MDKSNYNRPLTKSNPGGHRQRISRARFELLPALTDLFAQKSFSGHKIDQILTEGHLSPEDRALFTELFYGFLRYGHQLLFLVDQFFSQPQKVPLKVKWILAIAFYQKLYLSRIPDHAMVSEAVEMARHYVGAQPFPGVVNAVLRKFLASEEKMRKLDDQPLWVQVSFPQWLAEHLSAQWSPVKFFNIAEALNVRAPTYIRVNPILTSEAKLLELFAAVKITCLQTNLPLCLLLPDLSVSPKELPGYHEGWWTIQNMASQRVARFLDAHEHDTILDACAGFGGKTLQIAEMLHDKAKVFYFDIVAKKMEALGQRAKQMGFKHVKPAVNFEQTYSRILIDAPCSGLGSVASHPEIKWFRSAQDLAAQPIKQLEVLKNYARFLTADGKLLYAVCSIDKDEGEGVIARFLAESPEFQLDPSFTTPFENVPLGAYLLPTTKGETGYFFTRVMRKG